MTVQISGKRLLAGLLAGTLGGLVSAAVSADDDVTLPYTGIHLSHADELGDLYRIPDVVEASQVNNNTVGIVFSPDDEFDAAVRNLDAEISAHDGPRMVPILGKNDVQNIYDLLYLNNVDIALAHSDAIEYVRRIGNFPTVTNVVQSVLDVHQDKIAILASKDIQSVADLEGKKVAMGYYTSGAFITGTVIMDILGINVETVSSSPADGLEQLRNGEVSAFVHLLHDKHDEHDADDGHEGMQGMAEVAEFEGADQVHVLPLPDNDEMKGVYTQASLTADNLPLLISADESIPTYEVHTVLAAYRWRSNNPRYQKTADFVNSMIDTLDHLREGPQAEFWGDLRIDTVAPNVSRLAVVDQVLQQREEERKAELAAARAAIEARLEAERIARLERLQNQQDAIMQLIDERVSDANLQELENLLEELNTFVGKLDAEGVATGQ